MTFGQLKADTFRRCKYQPSPQAEIVARISAFLNEAHESILSEPGMAQFLYTSLTVASVASRARYGLSSVAQVRSITEATNDQKLAARSLGWYRAKNPDPASSEGTPEAYVPLGIVAVQQVPASTGTGLWVESSSASDTTVTVSVDATRVGGYPHSVAPTTLTGTTRVQLGTLADYIDVGQFQLNTAAVGDVTLSDAVTGGNTLAVIPRGQTASRYWGFLLCPTPSSAITYTVDIEREIAALVHDTDEPLLPARFHRLLALDARMKEYEFTNDARYEIAASERQTELAKLHYALVSPDYVMVPGGGTRDEGSNLGPWFPSGRWS